MECSGFIGEAPTARVSGDGGYYLTASGDADLVMAVRTASGEWLCDDDSGGNTNPAIEIPASGEHSVWVGTFRGHARGQGPSATLTATADSPIEGGIMPLPPPPPGIDFTPNYFSEATYVPLDLTSRGMEMVLEAGDDMAELEMDVHGETSNPATGNACSGAVAPEASATITVEGAGPLTLTATAQDDLVLLVRTASGDWFCSDDASGRDPAVEIEVPAGGITVWVGTFSQGERAEATLTAHRAALVDVLPEDEEIFEEYEEMEGGFYSEGSYLGSGLAPEASAPMLVLDERTTVAAGGPLFNRVMGDACTGYISEAPSATVVGGGDMISFWASGDDDLTLTVRTPNGDWYCSDDYDGSDPGIIVTEGGDGVYAIWVGTFSRADQPGSARLMATQDASLPD